MSSRYEEGLRFIEESCGNGKDNVIALATIGMEAAEITWEYNDVIKNPPEPILKENDFDDIKNVRRG